MKKLITSKWFIVLAVSLLLIAGIVLSFIPGSPLKAAVGLSSKAVSPAQAGVKKTGNAFSDFWAAIADGIAIREENKTLKQEIADLKYKLNQYEEAAIRYEELKGAFHIRDTFSNYDIYGATILSREADEWFSVIRINAGKNEGISLEQGQSYPVVDVEMNLVGRVIETEGSNSKVLPLLHEGFSVAGKVNEVNGASVIICGDSVLKKSGLCRVKGIEKGVKLVPGTVIVTSGEGGLFPDGIPIGTIVSVDYSNPVEVTATLKPFSVIGELEDVFVMIPYNADSKKEGTPGASETSAQGQGGQG
ncbi:MAG: rod shape-determining protein MreC [Ruminococcaceae bacterium]|nr:rod shape-determining protein MreC [Oscillospiraceae bacterium]